MPTRPTDARVLLIGTTGQLGHALARSLTTLGPVVALDRGGADLSRPDQLAAALAPVLASHRPTIVVNAAAYTAVDKAETEPDVAHAVNATSPGLLAALAASVGATFVHYSTDYVFDGSGDTPWRETDTPRPLGVYAQSKLAGERVVAAACPAHVILRTSWVVSAHGSNFLKTILRLASERDTLRVVDDQIGAPTDTALLAQVTDRALRALSGAPTDDPRWGVYHVAPSGFTSWHGYAQHVVRQARASGRALKLTPEAIAPIPSSEYPLPAPRPLNSRLDTHKVRSTFGVDLPDWHTGLDHVLQQLDAEARP
jgi:dTDP-4-dehydrorhamnose reductase